MKDEIKTFKIYALADAENKADALDDFKYNPTEFSFSVEDVREETKNMVMAVMNILEKEYDITELENLGIPSVEEITDRLMA